MTKPSPTPQILQGTLDLMILSVLSDRALHGYAIAREIEQRARGALRIEEGSLYPALHRLARRGDLASEWRTSASGRRARAYRVTPSGRQQLQEQMTLWETLSAAISRVMRAGHPAQPEYTPHGWE